MSRSVPYRRAISDAVNWRQEQALQATIFILREIGPTGYLLQEEGATAPVKALIGDPHHCSCADFRKDRDLCRHLCWLLLRKFRLDRDDPLSWQGGLVEREINGLLAMRHGAAAAAAAGSGAGGHQARTGPAAADKAPTAGSTSDYPAAQRPIGEDDVCPICQEELLASRLPVTYCRLTCGNSVHMRCMHVWATHQKQQGLVGAPGTSGNLACPMCRGDFAPYALLMQELGNANTAKASVVQAHRVACTGCAENPIVGKCYRCVACLDCHLCQRCFNSPQVHPQQQRHAFQFRERPSQQWKPVDRLAGVGVPLSVAGLLQSRPGDFSEADYETLMALDAQPSGSHLTEAALARLRHWTVQRGHALTRPGRQCPMCLMAYVPGQAVRQLAPCRHVIHAACIDPLLLHRSAACPLDGIEVKPPEPEAPAKQQQQQPNNSKQASPEVISLGGPQVIGLQLQLSGSRLQSSPARLLPPLPQHQQQQQQQQQQSKAVKPPRPTGLQRLHQQQHQHPPASSGSFGGSGGRRNNGGGGGGGFGRSLSSDGRPRAGGAGGGNFGVSTNGGGSALNLELTAIHL